MSYGVWHRDFGTLAANSLGAVVVAAGASVESCFSGILKDF